LVSQSFVLESQGESFGFDIARGAVNKGGPATVKDEAKLIDKELFGENGSESELEEGLYSTNSHSGDAIQNGSTSLSSPSTPVTSQKRKREQPELGRPTKSSLQSSANVSHPLFLSLACSSSFLLCVIFYDYYYYFFTRTIRDRTKATRRNRRSQASGFALVSIPLNSRFSLQKDFISLMLPRLPFSSLGRCR